MSAVKSRILECSEQARRLMRVRVLRFLKRLGLGRAPDVLVVSAGGAGTTRLLKHLSRYRSTNSVGDRDGLKHIAKPTRRLVGGAKVVLLISDPSSQVSSLERRGLLRLQLTLLIGLRGLLARRKNLSRLFEVAAKDQEQRFRFSEFPVMVIPYAEIFESGVALADFLEIEDEAFISSFPARKARLSGPRVLD